MNGGDVQTITREQLTRVIRDWELDAQRDPSSHAFDTPEAKACHLWDLLMRDNTSPEITPCS